MGTRGQLSQIPHLNMSLENRKQRLTHDISYTVRDRSESHTGLGDWDLARAAHEVWIKAIIHWERSRCVETGLGVVDSVTKVLTFPSSLGCVLGLPLTLFQC